MTLKIETLAEFLARAEAMNKEDPPPKCAYCPGNIYPDKYAGGPCCALCGEKPDPGIANEEKS